MQAVRKRPRRWRNSGDAGLYGEGEYDMAGFSVGIVDKDKIITGARVKAGNKIIGIASSGIHSNGYSPGKKKCFSTRRA